MAMVVALQGRCLVNTLRFTSLTVAALLAACVPAPAATIHVPGEQPTIQAGIDAASYGDTVLVACDTYYEHDIVMKSGVCLTSETGEADCATIDAQELGRVIYCLDVDDAASILGFTLTGGVATTAAAFWDSVGGGMYCENSSPTLTDCTLSSNTAGVAGGGMFCWTNAHPTLTDCTFSGNSAGFAGGGVFCYLNSDPTLTNCTFSGNSSYEGGGMCSLMGGFPTLTGCTFTDNTAYDGGGMIAFISWPELTDCTFSGNAATSVGGGMTSSESFPTLTDCEFSDNTAADFGGGLRVGANEFATITNCTFLGNAADRGGGVGVHSEGNLAVANSRFSGGIVPDVRGKTVGRQAMFTDCTFAGNEATYGGGVCCEDEVDSVLENCTFCLNTASNSGGGVCCDDLSTVTLTNSIIAFSLGGGAASGYCDGGVALYCSDVYGNSGGDWVDCIAGQDLINDNFSEDPLFCGDYNLDEPLTLRDDSPCASENNPACGLVGALDVACDTPVEMISWGAIKAMFR